MFNTVYPCYIPIVLPETVLIFLLCAQSYNCFFFFCSWTPLSSCFPTFLFFLLFFFFVRSTLNTVHCWWNKTSKRCCLKLHPVDLRSFLSPLVASLCAEWDAVSVWKVVRKLHLRPQSPLARERLHRPTDKRFVTGLLCSVTVALLQQRWFEAKLKEKVKTMRLKCSRNICSHLNQTTWLSWEAASQEQWVPGVTVVGGVRWGTPLSSHWLMQTGASDPSAETLRPLAKGLLPLVGLSYVSCQIPWGGPWIHDSTVCPSVRPLARLRNKWPPPRLDENQLKLKFQ